MGNIKYEVIVYWSNEDDCFISEMPELPGCMSDGKTYEEAITNIAQVAKMWIEVSPAATFANSDQKTDRSVIDTACQSGSRALAS